MPVQASWARPFSRAFQLSPFRFQLFRRSRRRVDLADGGADGHLGSLGDGDLEGAGLERGDLGGDLVGVEGEEKVADRDMVAVFLCQAERTPEEMDSPTAGTRTGTLMSGWV